MNKYHFFWKSKLSNWTSSRFIYGGFKYNCGEQMMMHQKAIMFKDWETALLIEQSTNPKEMKALGRQVKNFDPKIWDEYKYDLVKAGLYCRFTQDNSAKAELLAHIGQIFVKASPYDRIWGIGYAAQDAMQNIDNWGENLLGKILTELSKEICQ